MCGIAGFWTQRAGSADAAQIAAAMAERIAHRGPDDDGVWVDSQVGFAVGHRRLAIIDLSPAGHQPMVSASGRWVLAFNGEVYNHNAIRRRLEAENGASQWRGHSDTETLLAAVECWGPELALARIVGMFAIVLWDSQNRELWLARDRMGEKPLYYGWQDRVFLFASELSALKAHPAFSATVDRDALAVLLRFNYIAAPYSIIKGIRKLPAGCAIKLQMGQRDVSPVAYWSLKDVALNGLAKPFEGDEDDAVNALEELLSSAVRAQMLADVPLGVLLSGGIDSTTIAALMQANSSRPVRSFTIGFERPEYDESGHAQAVASYLETEHTVVRFSARDALDLVPRLATIYDEPFADVSQLPTHLVMQLARQHVAVALSGDGGDELFGGYNRYTFGPRVWRQLGWMPTLLRRLVGAGMSAVPLAMANRLGGIVGRKLDVALAGDKLHKLGPRLGKVRKLDDLYISLVSEWQDNDVVLGGSAPSDLIVDRSEQFGVSDPVARMMLVDGLTYLPDDILTKVDRAAMSVSLETRCPFLDHNVVAFAWSLPMPTKLSGGEGKRILRRLLDRYVPRSLVERPKVGFAVPLDEWLRGSLREWAESLLSEDRLRREGFFDPAPIRAAWLRHVKQGSPCGYRLWSVLMFQAWLENQSVSH